MNTEMTPETVAQDMFTVLHGQPAPVVTRHVQGYDVIEIEIRSTDGRAVLEVDQELLQQFVDASLDLVPAGEEAAHMDLDAEILKITRSCAG